MSSFWWRPCLPSVGGGREEAHLTNPGLEDEDLADPGLEDARILLWRGARSRHWPGLVRDGSSEEERGASSRRLRRGGASPAGRSTHTARSWYIGAALHDE
jgi:hypothetical protein